MSTKHRATHKLFVLLATVSLLAGSLGIASTVLAVHDEGIFQLEGDASTADQSTPPAAEDWDLICKAHLSTLIPPGECVKNPAFTLPSGNTAATESIFIADVFGSGTDDIYTTGGSKDDLDIPSWKFKNAGPSPDKNDIEHAFAAKYTCTAAAGCTDDNGDKLIYFGADRFTNEGDANIAFWFLQSNVAENGDGATPDLCESGGGCGFTGAHVAHGPGVDGYICYPGQTGPAIGTPAPAPDCASSPSPGADDTRGDILIVSAFTSGGDQPNIAVYEWVGLGNAPNALKINSDRSLVQIPLPGQLGTEGCLTALLSEDAACAVVNVADGVVAPWTFTEKADGPTNEYQASELYEGGLNLTKLGLAELCFSTFLVNTRSSQSPDSVLHDFALGPLGGCVSSTVTTPKTPGTPPAVIPPGGLSIGTGSVAVIDEAEVTVTGITGFGGSVTFRLCGPTPLTDASYTLCTLAAGTVVGAVKPVSGASPVTVTSDTVTVTSVGRYCFRADYTGDAAKGVPGSSDNAVTECFSVNPVTPTLVTQASATVPLGQAISDTATISGTASQPAVPPFNTTGATGAAANGTISFTAFGPDSCTTVAFGPVTRTVSGDGTYPTASQTAVSFIPTAAGTYEWVASYSGDSPNTNGVPATACPFPGGSETVIVNNSATVTTPNDGSSVPISGPLSIGTGSVTVRDNAVVTGTGNTTDPTGTVKFFLCGPIATGNCATGGTQVGSPALGETLLPGTLNDSVSSVFSDIVTITSVGRYCFRAEYSGDSLYPATSDPTSPTDTSTTECFVVNPVTPTLVTQASANTSLGNPISDTATISGTASQPVGTPPFNTTGATGAAANGTISFTAFGPDSCDTIAFGPVTRTVSGDNTYPTASQAAVSFIPTLPGEYVWVASYSGDSPNTNGVPATACSAQPSNEKVTVTQTQITTTPSVFPNDSATITVANGAAPSGSVVFSLYDTFANCGTGTATGRLFTETVALPAGASLTKTVGTHNGDPTDAVTDYSHTDLAATTLFWRVSYGNDPNHQGRNSLCLESTAIDHTADSSGGTAP